MQIERWTKDPWDAALLFDAGPGAQTGEKGEYIQTRVPERFESALRRGAMPQSVLHQVAKDEGMNVTDLVMRMALERRRAVGFVDPDTGNDETGELEAELTPAQVEARRATLPLPYAPRAYASSPPPCVHPVDPTRPPPPRPAHASLAARAHHPA
jgi:hypothetical protein